MSAQKSGATKDPTRKVATPARVPAKSRRQQTTGAAPSSQSTLARTARAIGKQVSDNPLATLAGAAAVTAGIALLLPAGRREAEILGEVAGKIGEVARDAADSAVDAGRQQVAGLAQTALGGIGGNVVESLIGGAAATAAGQAE